MSEIYILSALVIAVAFFGESMFGFGGGLIAIPLLSIFMPVPEAVTLVLIAQVCMGLLIFKTYKQIDLPAVLPITVTAILGTIAGTLILSMIDPNVLRLILAAMIIAFLVKTYWFSGVVIGNKHRLVVGNIAGTAGGLFQGLIGIGGPVLTMYLSAVIKKKDILRASLIYLLFILCVLRALISVHQGLFTPQLIKMAAIVLPFFLLAIILGQVVHHKISEALYRQAINGLLLISAVTLIVRTF